MMIFLPPHSRTLADIDFLRCVIQKPHRVVCEASICQRTSFVLDDMQVALRTAKPDRSRGDVGYKPFSAESIGYAGFTNEYRTYRGPSLRSHSWERFYFFGT